MLVQRANHRHLLRARWQHAQIPSEHASWTLEIRPHHSRSDQLIKSYGYQPAGRKLRSATLANIPPEAFLAFQRAETRWHLSICRWENPDFVELRQV